MATMQQLLAWLKDLSNRRSNDGGDCLNPCRASMKLPPIPKEFQSRCPDVSRYYTDSPAHIYEEIPPQRDVDKPEDNENTRDLNGDTSSTNGDSSEARDHDVDVNNLAFDKAKTFGAYLVVPMEDKLNATGAGVSCVAAEPRQPVTSDCLDESCCSRKTSTSDSGVSVETSGGSERGHDHCTRHRRPHGVYDDVPCMAYDDDVIERDLARCDKTALGRAMFLHRDHNREHFAVQVENVPAHHRDNVFYNDLDYRCDMSVPCEGNESSQRWRSQSDIPSNESSDGSSVYPTSLSDGERRVVTSGGLCCSNSSDSNNDTFSDYGVHCHNSGTRDSLFRRPSEYDYLLSRVRHNFTLGAEVQRHIRSSDSSDYEMNSSAFSGDGYDDINDDIVSLTSITSLSGISSTDERESRMRPHPIVANRTRCRGNTTKGEAHSRGRPSAVSEPPKQRKSSTVNGVDSRKTRRTKPVEYYRLPDFPHRTATASAAHTDYLSDKLSCRATTFHRAGKPETRKTHDRSGNTHARPAVHAKHPSNSQNRLLTDLMRMNHDRQLLVLF